MNFIQQFFVDSINAIWGVTGDYGVAIIIFSVILRLLIAPAQHMQVASGRRLQEVTPLRQAIEKRYKGDPKRIQEETLRLYKEYNINPMASCLPLLIQLPIIYLFFGAMRSFEYLGPASFLWVSDLSQPDPWLLPILAGLSTFLLSRLTTPQTGDAGGSMQMMIYIMPIVLIWITRQVPAGLALYWVVSNLFGVLQQVVYPPGGRGAREATS